MAEIEVELVRETDEELEFDVLVREGSSETRHRVELARLDLERLAGKGESPQDLVRRCFDFLLAREPKESILREFDVSVISRYFPEFEDEIGHQAV